MKKTAKRGKGVGVFARLGNLYERMSSAYGETAAKAGLSCEGCQQNCCYSYFQHHTYIEWSYLWRGMNELPQERRDSYLQRAHEAVRQYQHSLSMGLPPSVMCPLNDDGLCGVYKHRLMICRMHGTRNMLLRPDGQRQLFRGCYRFCGLTDGQPDEEVPTLDRTLFYRRLAELEMEHCAGKGTAQGRAAPRVSLTLAEMLVYGPPKP